MRRWGKPEDQDDCEGKGFCSWRDWGLDPTIHSLILSHFWNKENNGYYIGLSLRAKVDV